MNNKEIFQEVVSKLPNPQDYPNAVIIIPFMMSPPIGISNRCLPSANEKPYKEFMFEKSICGTYWEPKPKEFENFKTQLTDIFNK